MNQLVLLYISIFVFVSCKSEGANSDFELPASDSLIVAEPEEVPDSIGFKNLFIANSEFMAKSYSFPVGFPDASGYYNAQEFGENYHLGEDWNANTGGNSDLGDPIFAVANGYVKGVQDHGGGWGWVIRIIHMNEDSSLVESIYAHCDTVFVSMGNWIKRGSKIGTIGNAHGSYLAHLHFEMRDDINMPLGGGYGNSTKGFMVPTWYIKRNRGN